MELSSDKPQQKQAVAKPVPTLSPGFAFPQFFQPAQPAQAFYGNGFELTVTGADVLVTISQNERTILTLNLSFTTAKALGMGLSHIISTLESKSQTKVPGVEDVAKALGLNRES